MANTWQCWKKPETTTFGTFQVSERVTGSMLPRAPEGAPRLKGQGQNHGTEEVTHSAVSGFCRLMSSEFRDGADVLGWLGWFAGWWLGKNPSEKYEFVHWDDETPNINGTHQKMATKPPSSFSMSCASSRASQLLGLVI